MAFINEAEVYRNWNMRTEPELADTIAKVIEDREAACALEGKSRQYLDHLIGIMRDRMTGLANELGDRKDIPTTREVKGGPTDHKTAAGASDALRDDPAFVLARKLDYVHSTDRTVKELTGAMWEACVFFSAALTALAQRMEQLSKAVADRADTPRAHA